MTRLCFLDLDGVLVDFAAGARAFHGIPADVPHVWDFWSQVGLTDADFWAPLGRDFWAGLPLTPDGPAVLRAVFEFYQPDDVFLCSSPCLTRGCTEGKAAWVSAHLPEFSRRLILTGRKEVFAGLGRVLVDDHDPNLVKWQLAGGWGCSVPRPWNEMGVLGLPVVETVRKQLERISQP